MGRRFSESFDLREAKDKDEINAHKHKPASWRVEICWLVLKLFRSAVSLLTMSSAGDSHLGDIDCYIYPF